MQLSAAESLDRLAAHDHAVLCTLHPDRGPDAVPVVYAVVGDRLAVPVDLVKPKASLQLQRERNLEADPRATLLAEHWDRDDWSQLWWVRASLRWEPHPEDALVAVLSRALAERYPQYADEPFARLIVLRIEAITGWSGTS
ncbi:MAG: pyridoxamine 5'-phosphate oxidase family protein [Ilumatobacteraceae bacterium]